MRLCKVLLGKELEKKAAAVRCIDAALRTSPRKNPSLYAAAEVAEQEFRDASVRTKTIRHMAEERFRFAAALKARQTGAVAGAASKSVAH